MVSARSLLAPVFVCAACALVGGAAHADVHLVRSATGSALIFNDNIGSGWRVNGHAPSDAYLIERRDATTPFDDAIAAHAHAAGVDPSLVKSVMLVESNYNPRARSRKGACGLMQLIPATAARYGVGNIFDPIENIRGGVRYLADLLEMFGGNVANALAAYNAGENAVTRYSGIPPYAETREYVRRAMVAYHGTAPVFPASGPVIGGAFRGIPTESRVARGATVGAVVAVAAAPSGPRVQMDRTARVLSNDGPVSKSAPVLGRLGPSALASITAPAVAPLLGRVR
jgi:hypothetical protein